MKEEKGAEKEAEAAEKELQLALAAEKLEVPRARTSAIKHNNYNYYLMHFGRTNRYHRLVSASRRFQPDCGRGTMVPVE